MNDNTKILGGKQKYLNYNQKCHHGN